MFGALPALLRLRVSWAADSRAAAYALGVEHVAAGGGPRSSRLARATIRRFRRSATSGCRDRPPRLHSAHARLAQRAQPAASPRARHSGCWRQRRAAAANIERRAHVPLALAARAVPAAPLRPRGARPDDGGLHCGAVTRQPADSAERLAEHHSIGRAVPRRVGRRRNCRVRQRPCGCGHLPAAAHLPLATCGHCAPRCGRHPCAVDNGAASGGGGGAQGTRARSTVRRRRMGVVSLQRAPHELPHDSTHEPASRRWSHGRRCTARSTAYSAAEVVKSRKIWSSWQLPRVPRRETESECTINNF